MGATLRSTAEHFGLGSYGRRETCRCCVVKITKLLTRTVFLVCDSPGDFSHCRACHGYGLYSSDKKKNESKGQQAVSSRYIHTQFTFRPWRWYAAGRRPACLLAIAFSSSVWRKDAIVIVDYSRISKIVADIAGSK